MPPKKQKKKNNVGYSVVNQPIVKGNKVSKAKPPSVTYVANGDCRVSHMEYVQDVSALASPGSSLTLSANPQSPAMFTWLSALASRFEMYRFSKLKFHYKPSCATTTPGFVVLGFDFDDYDPTPTKQVMLAWRYSSKAPLWDSCTLDVSKDSRLLEYKYCNVSTPGDRRLDFLGHLVGLFSSTTTVLAGELFVEYTVEFRQPAYKVPPAIAQVFNQDVGWDISSQFFGSATSKIGNLLYEVVSPTQIKVVQPGRFMVSLNIGGPTPALPTVTITSPANAPWSSGSLANFSNNSGPLSASAAWDFIIDTAPMFLNISTLPASLTFGRLRFSTFFDTSKI